MFRFFISLYEYFIANLEFEVEIAGNNRLKIGRGVHFQANRLILGIKVEY
ncbi:hypothetical protein JCM15765_24070 [Paradesulfitobacterium aromaticivorans]